MGIVKYIKKIIIIMNFLFQLLEGKFNINATFHSSSEEDEELDDKGCVLCGHLKFGGCDILENIEHSQHTFADVLKRLFGKNDQENVDSESENFDSGKLCTICKVRLQNLYRLQRELREEKSDIMNIFKESHNIRKERKLDKNVSQILSEMKSARKIREENRNKRKIFKNKSDSLLDYKSDSCKNLFKEKNPQKTPEQNKSNIKHFTIQSLKKRKDETYLVKWDGFSDEDNTWEPRWLIPEYILKFYEEDPERLGLPAPSLPTKFDDRNQPSSEDESSPETEKFDISSIISGLYQDDKNKNKTVKNHPKTEKVTHEKVNHESLDTRPPKKRFPTGGLNKIPTKAALKLNSDSDSSAITMKGLNNDIESPGKEKNDADIFDMSFDGNYSKNVSTESVDESPHNKAKDSKKKQLLGKIFVSTPERKKSQEHQSEEVIKAVLREEDIYNIEALVSKKGTKYLVKWENFPHEQNTWEPRSAIPPFIVKFYEQNLSRLGQPVPAPPSPESEYIPAVDSVAEDSEGGHYERDDDWRPKDKKRRRKSGSVTGKKTTSKAANDSFNMNNKEKDTKQAKKKIKLTS